MCAAAACAKLSPMIRRPVLLLLAAAATLMLAACGSSSDSTSSKTTTAAKKVKPVYGTVNIEYATPKNKSEQIAQEVFSAGQTKEIAQAMASNFKLPSDIKLEVVNGFVGPNWNPQTRAITLSYGFLDYMAGIIRKNNKGISDYDLGTQLGSLNGFILLHEMGHMLVNQLSLPVTGKEEDAVDELAAVMMLKFVKDGDDYSFNAAKFFHDLSSDRGSLKESNYWDVHSLDEQRAYNIVCWVAGSSQADYASIQKLGILGADRLQGCPQEFEQKVNSWFTLLKPYFRKAAQS